MTRDSLNRAVNVVAASGGNAETVRWILEVLSAARFEFVDEAAGDFVVRCIDTRMRAVPPEADTIIRTITRTTNDSSTSTTHWLEGLRGPPT
jgi:hypothetical protein